MTAVPLFAPVRRAPSRPSRSRRSALRKWGPLVLAMGRAFNSNGWAFTSAGGLFGGAASVKCCTYQARDCATKTLQSIYVKKSDFPSFPSTFYFSYAGTCYYVQSSDTAPCGNTTISGLVIQTDCTCSSCATCASSCYFPLVDPKGVPCTNDGASHCGPSTYLVTVAGVSVAGCVYCSNSGAGGSWRINTPTLSTSTCISGYCNQYNGVAPCWNCVPSCVANFIATPLDIDTWGLGCHTCDNTCTSTGKTNTLNIYINVDFVNLTAAAQVNSNNDVCHFYGKTVFTHCSDTIVIANSAPGWTKCWDGAGCMSCAPQTPLDACVAPLPYGGSGGTVTLTPCGC